MAYAFLKKYLYIYLSYSVKISYIIAVKASAKYERAPL